MDAPHAPTQGGLEVHRDGALLRVVLRGAVDLVVRERDAPVLWTALADPGLDRVEVDAGAVTFLDSSGLSVLVRLVRDAADAGVGLRVVAASERVEELLEVTGVREWMASIGTSAGGR